MPDPSAYKGPFRVTPDGALSFLGKSGWVTVAGSGDLTALLAEVLVSPGVLATLDAHNLTNVPLPEGLFLSSDDTGQIFTGDQTGSGNPGSFDVGGGDGDRTQVLSGPNTLGPLDATALLAYSPDVGSLSPLVGNIDDRFFDENGIANVAIMASFAGQDFNDFFFANGANYLPDTNLSGNGAFSFGYGMLSGDGSAAITATAQFILASFTVGTVPSPSLYPAGGVIYVTDAALGANLFISDGTIWRNPARVALS